MRALEQISSWRDVGSLSKILRTCIGDVVTGFRLSHSRLTWDPFLESPEKPFVKLQPAYSGKLVFSYIVKGIKIKITAKFGASRCLILKIQRELCDSKNT